MIVRRLCVTPAVGSLMQWLLTSRNRTTERTDREHDASTTTRSHTHKEYEMSQESDRSTQKTQQLLQGPLKHVRAAALAAALLPLASVAVSPAPPRRHVPIGRHDQRLRLERHEQQRRSGCRASRGSQARSLPSVGVAISTDVNGVY